MGKDSKKSKKHKKEKKHISKKDKKKKRHYSSSSDSGSSEEWVEKDPIDNSGQTKRRDENPKGREEKPKEREEWMSMNTIFSGKTRSELNENKKKEDEQKPNLFEQPGQSTRELNPFWKNGGTGLPPEEHEMNTKSSRPGDRGAEWMRKALQRAKEQAEDEGRSVESVIAERWGSLNKFNERLKEAESGRERRDYSHHRRNDYTEKSRADNEGSKHRSRENTSHFKKLNFKKPGEEDSSSYDKNSRHYHSSSSRQNWRKPGYENKQELRSENESKTNYINKDLTSEKTVSEETPDNEKQSNSSDEDRELTLSDLNHMSADILRAELSGNMVLAKELERKLQKIKARRNPGSSTGLTDEKGRNVRLLTETDNRGFSRPVGSSVGDGYSRKRKTNTHEGKDRVRYFADDDKYSLQDMFEREKFNSESEQDSTFYKIMKRKTARDEDDEAALDAARMDSQGKDERKRRERAITKYAAREKALDNCRWCFGSNNISKDTIVTCKNKIYLAVPSFTSLTDRHCLIVPQQHVSCATLLDEDVWDEIMDLRKKLVHLLEEDEEDVIFFESALYIDKHPHMILHCVPVPKEVGDTAPIFFKKAIMECESEWSNNKKVVELAGRNVRKAVPKGLPYFAVDFGMQSGYAHVIEDKRLFPHNFAQVNKDFEKIP